MAYLPDIDKKKAEELGLTPKTLKKLKAVINSITKDYNAELIKNKEESKISKDFSKNETLTHIDDDYSDY